MRIDHTNHCILHSNTPPLHLQQLATSTLFIFRVHMFLLVQIHIIGLRPHRFMYSVTTTNTFNARSEFIQNDQKQIRLPMKWDSTCFGSLDWRCDRMLDRHWSRPLLRSEPQKIASFHHSIHSIKTQQSSSSTERKGRRVDCDRAQ